MSLITGNRGETTVTDWVNQVAVCLPVSSHFEGMPEPLLHVGLEAEALGRELQGSKKAMVYRQGRGIAPQGGRTRLSEDLAIPVQLS